MLAIHISIVESDAGIRKQGKLLSEVFAKKEVRDALSGISAATGPTGPLPAALLTTALGAITSVLPGILEKNGDDVLLDYDFSGREIARYHGSADGVVHTFENKKAAASLRVYTG